jgi:hypothetical protein
MKFVASPKQDKGIDFSEFSKPEINKKGDKVKNVHLIAFLSTKQMTSLQGMSSV